MSKNTTINLRVDSEVREQASEILSSLGLTLNEAVNLFLHQVRVVRGLPFEIKQRLRIELNDGHGSYICEYGHVHDYSKFDVEAIEREIENPNTKIFYTVDEMWSNLNEEDNGPHIS